MPLGASKVKESSPPAPTPPYIVLAEEKGAFLRITVPFGTCRSQVAILTYPREGLTAVADGKVAITTEI